MRPFVLILLTALLAFGADVTGKWKASYDTQNGARDVFLTFQLTDGKLTGTAADPRGEVPISEAKLDGDKITFTVQTDQATYLITGTVSGDEMKLTAAAGDHKIDLSAKRIKD